MICFQLAQYLLIGLQGPTFGVVNGTHMINLDNPTYAYRLTVREEDRVRVDCKTREVLREVE